MDNHSHAELKEYGNRYFDASLFQKAITCYSNAIKKQPTFSNYYTNRALCYLKLLDYDKCINDCRQSLEYDSMNIKAYFYMGQASLELGNYDEALIRLLRAHDLSLEQHKNYGDDITTLIRLAKKLRFEKNDAKKNEQEIELQEFLEKMIKEKFNKRTTIDDNDANVTGSGEPEVNCECQRRLMQVQELFNKIKDCKSKQEVPDYLCGRISFEIMRDPVVSPSGITYDRQTIVEHLHRVGHFDPITRQPLTEEKLVCNVSMREVINTFLEENPWAENY